MSFKEGGLGHSPGIAMSKLIVQEIATCLKYSVGSTEVL